MIRERHIWGKEYRGIYIEAVSWRWPSDAPLDLDKRVNWCGYIYLNSKTNPEINEFEVDYSAYTDRVPYFHRFSFHGGITFSEVTMHNETKRMKIGCDYQHYHDEGNEYDHNDVLRDLETVVDEYRVEHEEKK